MLSDITFTTMNRRQKWIEIATLHLQLSTDFIKLYLQLMYSKLCTIFHSFGNEETYHVEYFTVSCNTASNSS